MPRIIQHAISADEARRGDMYNDVTIGHIKRGPVRVTFFNAEDEQFAYLRRTDVIRVARSEPTPREDLEKELELVEHFMQQYDERILRGRAYNATTAFQEAITNRNETVSIWATSFQLESFIQEQATAMFFGSLPLCEEFDDTPDRPAQTTRDRLVILVDILESLRRRYLDRSPSHSTSALSNVMDEAHIEAHRKAITGYFGSGLNQFEWHLAKVRELEQAVVEDEATETVTLVSSTGASAFTIG